MKKIILGELLGTFVLVVIGTGSVAVAVLYETIDLIEIAGIWALAVALGIYASSRLSDAHLNPAVSIGFLIHKDIPLSKFPLYILGQFLGSILAGIAVFIYFKGDIESFLISNPKENLKLTASMFGEFYPNPGNKTLQSLSTSTAFLLETLGTFVLMLSIFIVSNIKSIPKSITPLIIGITVGALIIIIAPYTQACFNPFRDFGPRIVSYFTDWKSVAFDLPQFGFFTVYFMGPIIGGSLAALLHKKMFLTRNVK